jgi:DNA-binding transcriptional MerR regulator
MRTNSTKLKKENPFKNLELLTSSDLAKMFNVSTRTITNWRNSGLLNFNQIKSVFFYSHEDVQDFITNTRSKGNSFRH